ncbi:alpha/beta fold hydrolase [Actinomyces israelii]|uniref:Alpha/beta fold hydrolase n=1 Tax=Actinomyces israelii TaxID=1659 RepID=A0ABT4IAD1_9ACTO|nr:alpha/beta fold hydrolase [Actinomyces israelii]MCZ0858704.1 alpha/beta fold hydrolase [Actinomyces israelii]
MQTALTHMTADDGARLAVRTWLPDGAARLRTDAGARGGAGAGSPPAEPADPPRGEPPRAIIQVVHGMTEHSARYERLATAAVAAGYGVVADDHRGHGLTAPPGGLGHVADRGGWGRVLADISAVLDAVRASWPGAPVVLLGHSWGSFLVRLLAARRGRDLAGLIVMGTGGDPGAAGRLGGALGALLCRLRGPATPGRLLHALAFGGFSGFNRPFAPARTEVDWLSRDEAEVDAYVADPLCGFVCSNAFFRDLAAGPGVAARAAVYRATPRDLPVLVASGDRDPVGAAGRGPRQVADAYRRAGVHDVVLRLYPGARHEVLNETNREEVTRDLLDWISARL